MLMVGGVDLLSHFIYSANHITSLINPSAVNHFVEFHFICTHLTILPRGVFPLIKYTLERDKSGGEIKRQYHLNVICFPLNSLIQSSM